jgi:hypothetical protein
MPTMPADRAIAGSRSRRCLGPLPIVAESFDPGELLALAAALRGGGGERADPVGLHLVERLAARLEGDPALAGPDLVRRLARAIDAHRERVLRAEASARASCERAARSFPHAVAGLEQLRNAGDLHGVRSRLARLEGRGGAGPLASLLAAFPDPTPDGDLRAARRFRATWSRLSVARQLARARAHAPRNAGPLNAEHLVMRALDAMQALSPDYLQQFLSGVEALFWLDRAGAAAKPGAAATPGAAASPSTPSARKASASETKPKRSRSRRSNAR